MVESTSVFKCEQHDDTFIVMPLGHSLRFAAGQVELQAKAVAQSIDESDIKHVIVDLKSVTLLDSIVIGAIIMFAKAAMKRDGKAILCNVSEQLWETLSCVRLDKLMDRCATREEALAALKT